MFLEKIKTENSFEMCYAVTRVTLNSSAVRSIQKDQCKLFSPL